MQNTKYKTSYKYSPYSKISKKRIKKTKFNFRFTKQLILKNKKLKSFNNLCDLGCANGEFIYYLNNHLKKNYIGVDNDKKFIDTAKKLLGKNNNIKLIKKDLYNLKGKFDVITCIGTATTFPTIDQLLNKIVSLMAPKGLAIIEGVFNKYDCDVKIKYKDSSKKEQNFWNNCINIHSQKTIKKILNRFEKINSYFIEKKIDVQIKKEKNKPHSFWWTEKVKKEYFITNGLLIKKDPVFLIIKKN